MVYLLFDKLGLERANIIIEFFVRIKCIVDRLNLTFIFLCFYVHDKAATVNSRRIILRCKLELYYSLKNVCREYNMLFLSNQVIIDLPVKRNIS